MKKTIAYIAALLLILYFHAEVIDGAASGLLLWYRTLIPSLLPFIIITNALSESHAYDSLTVSFGRHTGMLYILCPVVLGNLCGYPIGAKMINDLTAKQLLNQKTSNLLIALSSQASPMFLIGYVHPLLPTELSIPVFLLLIYLPTTIFFFILFFYIKAGCLNECNTSALTKKDEKNSFDNSAEPFINAAKIMVVIGIYVMIFSILISILMPKTNSLIVKCIISFLEITNGLQFLSSLDLTAKMKVSLMLCLSSFGGLCSAFQIMGVLTYHGASIKKYLSDKLILSSGTFLLTWLYVTFVL